MKIKSIFGAVLAAAAVMMMSTAVWAKITAYDYTDPADNTQGKELVLDKDVTWEEIRQYSDKEDVLYVFATANFEMPEDCLGIFYDYSNLRYVDFSNAKEYHPTRLRSMFANCGELKTVDFGPIKTEKTEDMSDMFYSCHSLKTIDLSGFDTSSVKDMSGMFHRCTALGSIDVSGFDTSSAENMHQMFAQCYELTSLDLSSFTVGTNTDVGEMFYDSSVGVIKLGKNFTNIPAGAKLKNGTGWTSENGYTSTASGSYAVIGNTEEGLWISNDYLESFLNSLGGSGTESDPYIITAYDDLRFLVKIIDKFKGDVSDKDFYIQLSSDDEISEIVMAGYSAIEITGGENICLDLNGVDIAQGSHLSNAKDSMFYIKNGKMTVKDSIGSGSMLCGLYPLKASMVNSCDYAMFRLDTNGKLEINSGLYDADYFYNKVIATTPDFYHKSAYDTEFQMDEGCPLGALTINGGTFKTKVESVLTCGIINGGDFNGSYRFTNDSLNGSASGYYGTKGIIYNCTLNGTLLHKDSGEGVISSKSGVKINGVLQTSYANTLNGNDIIIGQMYQVTFNRNGHGTTPVAQDVFWGDTASAPAMSNVSGYVFTGWYVRPTAVERFKYDFGTPVTEDITLYAGWQGDCTVTFDVGEGMGISPETQYIPAGSKATCPDEPRYLGYVFIGWYTSSESFSDRTKFDFDSEVTGDVTLYALWKEPVSGQITLKIRDTATYGAYYGDDIILVAPEDFEKDYSWTVTKSDGTTTEVSTGRSLAIQSYCPAGAQSTFTVTGKVWNPLRGIYATESASFKLIVVNKPGDYAGNGLWDKYDASFILKYINGTRSFSEESLNLSETNNDGRIDMLDVVNILNAMEA